MKICTRIIDAITHSNKTDYVFVDSQEWDEVLVCGGNGLKLTICCWCYVFLIIISNQMRIDVSKGFQPGIYPDLVHTFKQFHVIRTTEK